MKTAILYCSHHGTTEKIAGLLAEKLRTEKDIALFNLEVSAHPDVSSFERIIIGGSIHAGKIQKNIKLFCEDHREMLLSKQLGLFICGMLEDKLREEFEDAFPLQLREHATAHGCFGGEFLFERMNIFEKLLVRSVAKTRNNVHQINYPAIDNFVFALNETPKS